MSLRVVLSNEWKSEGSIVMVDGSLIDEVLFLRTETLKCEGRELRMFRSKEKPMAMNIPLALNCFRSMLQSV